MPPAWPVLFSGRVSSPAEPLSRCDVQSCGEVQRGLARQVGVHAEDAADVAAGCSFFGLVGDRHDVRGLAVASGGEVENPSPAPSIDRIANGRDERTMNRPCAPADEWT